MGKGKHVSEDEFGNIKNFQKAGVDIATVSKGTGRSYNTINRIYAHDDYESYKLRNQPQEEPTTAPELPEPSQIDNKAVQYMLQNINDNLVELRNSYTEMQNSLAWLEKNVVVAEPSKIVKRRLW